MFEEGRLEAHVRVRVEYEDILGGSYSHEWEIHPLLYADLRTRPNKSKNEPVEVEKNLAQENAKDGSRKQM